jgi:hypothetical protein
MATINLGAIKFNWKGAYNSSTTYAVDDVVSSGGNSYVCIQAHSNQAVGNATAYWNIMSSKGTDADLLNISSTAQGDIYYNNGSAIARLGAGTSGQVLKTQGAGANPIWGADEGGKILQVVQHSSNTNYTQNGSGSTDCTNYNVSITPSSASNKLIITMGFRHMVDDRNCTGNHEATGEAYIRDVTNSANIGKLSHLNSYVSGESRAQNMYIIASRTMYYAPNTTSAVTYSVRLETSSCYASLSYGDFTAVLMEIAG